MNTVRIHRKQQLAQNLIKIFARFRTFTYLLFNGNRWVIVVSVNTVSWMLLFCVCACERMKVVDFDSKQIDRQSEFTSTDNGIYFIWSLKKWSTYKISTLIRSNNWLNHTEHQLVCLFIDRTEIFGEQIWIIWCKHLVRYLINSSIKFSRVVMKCMPSEVTLLYIFGIRFGLLH